MFNLRVNRYKPDTMSSACNGDLCDGWGLEVGWGWGLGMGWRWGWGWLVGNQDLELPYI